MSSYIKGLSQKLDKISGGDATGYSLDSLKSCTDPLDLEYHEIPGWEIQKHANTNHTDSKQSRDYERNKLFGTHIMETIEIFKDWINND